MRQTKLLELYRTFSAAEQKRWSLYLSSDYSSRNEALRRLAGAVAAMDEKEDIWDKKTLFGRVFVDEEPYNELKFNNLVSDLYALTLDWLALERVQQQELALQRERTLALLDRHLNLQAETALQKYHVLLERSPLRNAAWHAEAARMEAIAEVLHSRRRRADSPHLIQEIQHTQIAHAIEKLRLAVSLQSRSQLSVIQSVSESSFAADLDLLRADTALQELSPVASVYLAAYELLETPSELIYSRFTALMDKNHDQFGKEELGALYQCALNYCIRRINAGQTEAYSDALILYRRLLDRGLLLQQGRISQWTYKNIATTGLRSGQFEWTAQFLAEYRSYLAPEERENAYTFNLAALYFEKNDYAKLLQTLQNVEFKDFSYHIGAKMLQLKTYYLLGEYEPLLSLISTSIQLLRRDRRLSTFGRTTNLNFLKMLRSVCNWKLKKSWGKDYQEEKARLILKITQLEPLANKDWLLKAV